MKMKKKSLLQLIIVLLQLLVVRLEGFAKDNYPLHFKMEVTFATDTIPPPVIKEVPKSRNQPIPVKIGEMPINIVKPKIIKPKNPPASNNINREYF